MIRLRQRKERPDNSADIVDEATPETLIEVDTRPEASEEEYPAYDLPEPPATPLSCEDAAKWAQTITQEARREARKKAIEVAERIRAKAGAKTQAIRQEALEREQEVMARASAEDNGRRGDGSAAARAELEAQVIKQQTKRRVGEVITLAIEEAKHKATEVSVEILAEAESRVRRIREEAERGAAEIAQQSASAADPDAADAIADPETLTQAIAEELVDQVSEALKAAVITQQDRIELPGSEESDDRDLPDMAFKPSIAPEIEQESRMDNALPGDMLDHVRELTEQARRQIEEVSSRVAQATSIQEEAKAQMERTSQDAEKKVAAVTAEVLDQATAKAHTDAQRMVREAEAEAERLRQDAETEAEDAAKSVVASAESEAEAASRRIMEEAEAEAERLLKEARDKATAATKEMRARAEQEAETEASRVRCEAEKSANSLTEEASQRATSHVEKVKTEAETQAEQEVSKIRSAVAEDTRQIEEDTHRQVNELLSSIRISELAPGVITLGQRSPEGTPLPD